MTAWKRSLSWILAVISRYPGYVAIAIVATPWGCFAASPAAHGWWAPAMDLSCLTGAGAAVVGGPVRLGVRPGRWTVLLAIYAEILNFVIAEFAYLYWSTSQIQSSSFSVPLSKLDAAYLSWTTFTTTGFGDIVPHSQLAHLEVTAEMALTFVAVAGGLAVLLAFRSDLRGPSGVKAGD